jgi:Ca-activated chloride channel family protein
MSSPVVVGLAEERVAEMGWTGDGAAGVTWEALAAAAGAGRFSYGMTDPASSNSGLSALIGVATALAGGDAPVESGDIDAAAPALERFFSARRLTDDTSGDLAERFVAAREGTGPGPVVDGLVNYESVLLSLNEDELEEPLTLLYPTDGVVVADYPLSLLAGAGDEARDGYDRLVRWLTTDEVQREIMDTTHRRPGVAGVGLDGAFGDAVLAELPFPADREVFDQLVEAYYDRLRRPVRMVYVLDVSGSMEEDDRIGQLRDALVTLTGADAAATDNPAHRFRAREEVTLLPFSTAPGDPLPFTIPESGGDEVLASIRTAADALVPGGDTAIYDTLLEAYGLVGGEDGAPAIVLMTDGENTAGTDFADFQAEHAALGEAQREIPLHVVHLGDANVPEMRALAALTGQEPIDATDEGLGAAFRAIREAQ